MTEDRTKPTVAPPITAESPRLDTDGRRLFTRTLGRSVACPECLVPAGMSCYRQDGTRTGLHLARVAVAVRAALDGGAGRTA